jgi:hypothetical protein
MEIYSISEWMEAMAEAIENRDIETIDKLENVSRGWMQGSDEMRAQLLLVDAIRGLIYETEEY